MKRCAVFLLALTALLAQNSVEGPITAWIWDREAAGIRPILGLPGASVFGELLDCGVRFTTVATTRRFSLGVAAEDGQAYLIRPFAAAKAAPLAQIPPGASRIVLSPSGDSAAFLYEDSHRISWVSGLPERVEVRHYNLENTPSKLAVSDGGAFLAVSLPDGLHILDRESNRWKLGHEGVLAALEFLHGSHDLLLGDERGLWLIRNVRNPDHAMLLDTPIRALAAAADRSQVVALDSEARLLLFQLSDRTVRLMTPPVEPSGLSRLEGHLFRIHSLRDEPMWLLDLSGPEPRMAFVPARKTDAL
ncbi:MAG: hypothetical protein NZV14_16155 [Bryobacteraceae bacterium]|nr:hypothetical protein [Bryobacteraceae bacterium]MDW8379695.1 hypothetical protein [Bryobacterales bacterium]